MTTPLPNTVLQFGGGRFLRGFADLFIHQANQEGRNAGRVTVVQSTAGSRADLLNQQGGRYHVLIQGLEGGRVIDRVEVCESVHRAWVAQERWEQVLEAARNPELRLILSNSTEAGYALDPEDRFSSAPPRSFPAKLLLALWARFEAGGVGVDVVPCELLEGNADRLRNILTGLATEWALAPEFLDWLSHACRWRNTLVDRIVTDGAANHPLAKEDRLLIAAEPYSLWAVERKEGEPRFLEHPALVYAPDITPYFLRKVRILNGAHTAMAPLALAKGYELVREAMADAEIRKWLEDLLFEEIVPTLEGRVVEPMAFAEQVLERFQNPFLEHRLANILTYHEQKQGTRLVPTREEFRIRFGREPRLLNQALGA